MGSEKSELVNLNCVFWQFPSSNIRLTRRCTGAVTVHSVFFENRSPSPAERGRYTALGLSRDPCKLCHGSSKALLIGGFRQSHF